ncbi:unnamed protein product [Clonostachys rhizophaga]|uniref:CBM1 domain-containing protein n=1 Tax=Clonostachys rhizophaga TaxID=160324 RepID=A0A9N9VM83_9HYPO|nr:unnamed protein product [Clonostachys rhizophaga]
MKRNVVIVFAVALWQGVAAQAPAYGQCGGNNWTGPTTCVAGYYCQVQNEWYSQCVPGTASTTSSTRTTLSTSTTSATSTRASSQPGTTSTSGACTGTFTPVSASSYVAALGVGWNLGNSLDATPNEDSWNNPPVTEKVFDYVVSEGFKTVRIPVTYTHHLDSESPNWTVNANWLQRVENVIDMALARNLYVITNLHHDSWEWADVTASGADITAIQSRFKAVWTQVATKLRCKSSRLSFESINEPPATTAAHGALINQFNQIFNDAVVASGGFNPQRVLQFAGGGMDATKTTQWFQAPSGVNNPWALQFHYYSPYDFVFGAWGKTIWGSAADKTTMTNEFSIVRGNFTNVPLILGEFDVSIVHTEPAARWKWFDHLATTIKTLGIAPIVWDNGLDHLDRNTGIWRDPVSIAILKAALAGQKNSLPDSTTDASATTQSSSAFIWNRVGSEVADYKLPWLFNGNTLTGVKTNSGKTLSSGSDYTTASDSITFTKSFLSQYLGPSVSTGSKANLTLTFSAGAFSNVEIIQWDTPKFLSTPAPVLGQDLSIPINYNGLKLVAAVRAKATDGTYLFDDWTQWLGPLQQARITYNGQFFFDGAQVVLKDATLQAVKSLGKPVEFLFEFYPRVEGNSISYTLTL